MVQVITIRPFDKLRVTEKKWPRGRVKITKEMRKTTPPHPCPLPQGERVKKGDFIRI